MSQTGVPYVGILATGAIALVGVGLDAVVPDKAFEIVLNVSALGTIVSWTAVVLCHLRLWREWRRGLAWRPASRLPGAPYTDVATLFFLATIVILMISSGDIVQRIAVLAMLVIMAPALIGGWFLARRRVLRIALIRQHHTGQFPVVAERPPLGPSVEPEVIIEDPKSRFANPDPL
jgi:L-asparagine permease